MVNRSYWNPVRVRQTGARVALALGLAVTLASCTSVQRDSQATSYLIIESLNAASGATPDEFGGTLASDVLTYVKTGDDTLVPTVYADPGEVRFVLGLTDPGTGANPNVPSSTNVITVTRYRVDFVRSDGRNTPGVDVPFGFDGGMTVSVDAEGGAGTFELVRIQAKLEAPLKALAGAGGEVAIQTQADVTFYGHDQAGREVKVTGRIGINFADWGDPS